MQPDMTVPLGGGLLNIRAGAILPKDGRFLMVGSPRADYLYSVGGRVKFGETAEEAVVREVYEETGVRMAVERLGFVHENYFLDDRPGHEGTPIYEISFYFYMNVPEDFTPRRMRFADDGGEEFLIWVAPDTEKTVYPPFFPQALTSPGRELRFYSTDERPR